MTTTFVKRLYGLYQNGALLTHISDNIATLQTLAEANDCILEIDTTSPDVASDPIEKSLETINDNFVIIENDREKKYGFSEVYQKETGEYNITMWKNRLVVNLLRKDVDEAIEDLTENPGIWEDRPTAIDAVNLHCQYWQHNDIPHGCYVPVFRMTSKMLQMLLTTCFEADILLLVG